MKSVNTVTLLGNVTRDPELKTTKSGHPVCTFGLATNRVWTDAKGERQSVPEFHNVVAWRGLSDVCSRFVRKGKPLFVEGYLKTHSWEDEQTKKMQYRTEVVLENMVLLGTRSDKEQQTEDPAVQEALEEGGEPETEA